MNSFESDMKRAVFSVRFLLAVLLQLLILREQGFSSTLYKMSVPLIGTLPYACGWLDEYKSGYVKLALVRTSLRGYIWSKFLACAAAGGGAQVLGAWLSAVLPRSVSQGKALELDYGLIFLNGMLWAAAAAVLAALSNSRYLAYGGAFVVYYFLVILCERYWERLYCLYPYEWLEPRHIWVFGRMGVMLLLGGILLVLALWYEKILRRRLQNV